MRTPRLVITGPTASGKTAIAVACARALNGEIVSADSRQIYKGMDIGTGKDLDDYGGDVRYHMIDIAPPGYKYNLFEYVRDASRAIEDIESRGKLPIICGGTGLYVETLIRGIQLPQVPENPELRNKLEGKSLEELTAILSSMKNLHNTTDVDTCKRAIRAIEIASYYQMHPDEVEFTTGNPLVSQQYIPVLIDISREERRQRISTRLRTRLENGMVEEIRGLIDNGVTAESLIYYGLEYKFVTQYVIGELSYNDMVSQLEIAIHQFAKRQMTWFRGMERRGISLTTLPFDIGKEKLIGTIGRLLEEKRAQLN